MLSISCYNLTKVRLLHFLEELKTNSIEFGTLYFPLKSSKAKIEAMMHTVLDMNTVPKDLSQSMVESPTGGVIFWAQHHWYLVMPPFPIDSERVSKTCEIEPLRSLMHNEFLLGLIIVRLGEYSIGIIRGDKLLSSKVGTGLVHSRHRQGGSSSHRFERHREKQMETFFIRVCEHARAQLQPYDKQLDYLLYGGTRETILGFRKQCHFLQEFNKMTLERLLNIRKAKRTNLSEVIKEAWSSRIIQWNEK